MKQTDREKIVSELSVLTGKSLFYMGRTAAIGDFGFRASEQEDYALTVQTAFRIYKEGEILIANLDMFEPADVLASQKDFDWNTYNWDVQGQNLYDEWADNFIEEQGGRLKVQKVSVSPSGDLKLEFEDGMVLEVFINTSGGECWRFFDRNAERRLVVCPDGVDE